METPVVLVGGTAGCNPCGDPRLGGVELQLSNNQPGLDRFPESYFVRKQVTNLGVAEHPTDDLGLVREQIHWC